MLALVLSDDPTTHHTINQCLTKRGFQVVNSESVMMATAHVRAWRFDLIVMTERVSERLTHQVALSAEKRAPFVKTLLLSDRKDAEVDELFELLPSLVSIVSPDINADLIAQIALASVAGRARVLETGLTDTMRPPQFSSSRAHQPCQLAA
ncbi:PleD family two-component system response regulator [Litoreibacter albidus]|uniref:hypothetical protein n=1 Tax=Litoreibacter albidus TaxID=670155 RepID=UPI003736265F